MSADRLAGCVAIISGSATGQGAAEARVVVAQGGKVVVADIQDAPGEALAADLGDAAVYHHLDVRSERDWRDALEAGIAAFGRVNALVNNAGIAPPPTPIVKTSVDEYRAVLDVNLVGAYTGIHVVAPAIVDAGGGSIVNISSVNGLQGGWGIAAYASSKFGLRGLTRVAAIELGRKGVRVNSVHPGPIDTPMLWSGLPAGIDAVEAMAALTPVGRTGTVDDVANVVAFLLSEESAYCHGAELVVDGGLLAGPLGAPRPTRKEGA